MLNNNGTYPVVVRSPGPRSGPSPWPSWPGAAARPAAATGPGPGTAAPAATAAASWWHVFLNKFYGKNLK